MKLFNRSSQESSPPKKEVKTSGLKLSNLHILFFLISALIFLACAYASYLLYAKHIEENIFDHSQVHLAHVSDSIQGKYTLMVQQIQAIASDPTIEKKLLASKIDNIPSDIDSLFKLILPDYIRALVVDDQVKQPIEDLSPPLSYACIDQQLSVSGRIGHFEVHRLSTKDQHVDLVIPLKKQNKRLIITFNLNLIKGWVNSSLPTQGYIEITQSLPGQEGGLTIIKAGDQSLATSAISVSETFYNKNWKITYKFKIDIDLLQQQHLIYLAIFIASVLVLAVVHFLFKVLISSIIKHDINLVSKHFDDFGKGVHHHVTPVRLAEFKVPVHAIDEAFVKYKDKRNSPNNSNGYDKFSLKQSNPATDYESHESKEAPQKPKKK